MRAVKRHRPLAVALAAALATLPARWPVPLGAFELVQPEARSSAPAGSSGEEPFSSLFVANPEVADVEVKSPRLVYLTGVGVGETTLFASTTTTC